MKKFSAINAVQVLKTTAVCFLGQDVRTKLIENFEKAAKGQSKDIIELTKGARSNIIIMATRVIAKNMVSLTEIQAARSFSEISDPVTKETLQNSIQLALQMSGWTQEEFDALVKIDNTAYTLSEKVSVVLSHPKEDSEYSQGLEVLKEYAAPFMMFIGAIKQIQANVEQELTEKVVAEDDDEHVMHKGLYAKHKTLIEETSILDQLEALQIPENQYHLFVNPTHTQVHIPDEIKAFHAKYKEADSNIPEAYYQYTLNTLSYMTSGEVVYPWVN